MFKHGAKPVIGLVGGIGAGKSTVARCLAERGGFVIEADALGHEALRQPEILQQLVTLWGEGIRKPDGSADRRAIAKIVFTNPEQRAALEKLAFPFIGKRCVEEIQKAMSNPTAKFVVLDAAVMLVPPDNRLSQSGTLLTRAALEAAGVPVLMLDADMVDAKHWDRDAAVARVSEFLRTRTKS